MLVAEKAAETSYATNNSSSSASYANFYQEVPPVLPVTGGLFAADSGPTVPSVSGQPQRLQILGDSTLMATSHTYFQSLAGQMQQVLYERGHNTEVVTSARAGSSSAQQFAIIQSYSAIRPEIVVHYTGSSEKTCFVEYRHEHPDWNVDRERWLQRSGPWALMRTILAIAPRFMNMAVPKDVPPESLNADITPNEEEFIRTNYEANLEKISNYCHQNRARLVFVPFVHQGVQAAAARFNLPYPDIVERVSRKHGDVYIDVLPDLQREYGSPLDSRAFIDWSHPRSFASHTIANTIVTQLEKLGILEKPNIAPILPSDDPLDLQSLKTITCSNPTSPHSETDTEYTERLAGEDTCLGQTQRGHLAMLRHEYEQAVGCYSRACDLNPEHDQAVLWRNLGHAYYHNKQNDNAVKAYIKFVAISRAQNRSWPDPRLERLVDYYLSHTRDN